MDGSLKKKKNGQARHFGAEKDTFLMRVRAQTAWHPIELCIY